MRTREVSSGQIKVLIVEDSIVCAEIIKHILESDSDLKVIGVARDGKEATKLVNTLNPDIITMDIHMPNMNGFEATEYIMAYHPTPILIVSSSIRDKDTELAFMATQVGALDVIEKPDPAIWESFATIGSELISKVKFLSKAKVITHIKGKRKKQVSMVEEKELGKKETGELKSYQLEPGALAIGASTGGPQTLAKILSMLPRDFPLPILVGQHISEGFLSGFISWLGNVINLEVVEARDMDEIEPGKVYVAPATCHMMIVEPGVIELVPPKEGDYYKPSVDLLFSSVANVFRMNAIGVLLTGMGSDGAKGMKKIYDLGGYTIGQDEKTSVVYGMPKAAVELGGVKEILSVDEIANRLIKLTLLAPPSPSEVKS